VVVYGATPSGVLAAVSAAREHARVALVEPSAHVGGMMSNGLDATDYGHVQTIGGYTAEFFDRTQAAEGTSAGRWRFQPSTAEAAFNAMLAGTGIQVYLGERLAEGSGAQMNGPRITEIVMESGLRLAATVFVDASYAGDLMAQAGVDYRVGREASGEYGESNAGVRPSSAIFTVPGGIDPGFPVSEPGAVGTGDARIQASNYRLCFSSDPSNQIPFQAPAGYDPASYDIVAAYMDSRVASGYMPDITWFLWPVALPDGKFDINNNGQVAIGIHGVNYGYPDGSYADRAAIESWLTTYTQGFLYFLAKDARVPQRIHDQMAVYGLCGDEFTDNGGWPRMLYLREGRRMVGAYVLNQSDVQLQRVKADGIAIASYAFDSHQVSRWIDSGGRLRVEGGFWYGRAAATRWSVPYRSLTPQASEATNLLVSVAVSATHVAMASLRMEPQYMMMGEAAGTAAAIFADEFGTGKGPVSSVQSVDVNVIKSALRRHGAVIDNYLFWDTPGNPFRGDIEATYLAGITFGCSPVYFCPSAGIPREVMAAWLANALDLGPASKDYFTDDEASPYEDAINRVAEANVTRGCGPTTFCPNATVTRGQMAAFLKRAFALPPTPIDFFTDDETSIFEGDINRLAASGITAGCGNHIFCPTATVTRGQMAAFLRRALAY
jgi:FAD dependent oxidoreductase/S-layer homology domain